MRDIGIRETFDYVLAGWAPGLDLCKALQHLILDVEYSFYIGFHNHTSHVVLAHKLLGCGSRSSHSLVKSSFLECQWGRQQMLGSHIVGC